MFFLLLFFFVLLFFPLLLIFIGIRRKRKTNGASFYFIGVFLLSITLPAFLMAFVPFLSGSKNENTIQFILFFAFLFLGIRLYPTMLYWESRTFIPHIKNFLQIIQTASYPDCTKVIVSEMRESIMNSGITPTPADPVNYSYRSVYLISSGLLNTSAYRIYDGSLNTIGMQLQHVAVSSLEYLYSHKFIDQEEYDSQKEYLSQVANTDFWTIS